jgi:hypothetical protein
MDKSIGSLICGRKVAHTHERGNHFMFDSLVTVSKKKVDHKRAAKRAYRAESLAVAKMLACTY